MQLYLRRILDENGIPHEDYVFPMEEKIEPDEYAVGSLTMAVDPDCDVILAVGSGVINDCSKVLAHACRLPSMVVCTAPSMDGYCSNSASTRRSPVITVEFRRSRLLRMVRAARRISALS